MRRFVLALSQKIIRDDCLGLAAEMAYNLILSIIPMMVFLTSLFGIFGAQAETYPIIIRFINRLAPIQSAEILTGTINTIIEGSSTNITVLGLLGMIFSASIAGRVMVKGLQRAYGFSSRRFPVWYNPVMAVFLVLSFGLLMVMATYLILFGNALFSWFAPYLIYDSLRTTLILSLRWVMALVAILWGVAFTYRLVLLPQKSEATWKKAFAGSLFFVVTWLLMSWLFSLYIDMIPQFNPIYGTFGAMIILVTWLYYSSLVFFIGGEITALQVSCEIKHGAATV
ncbi:MAG: YihY/virulence factor BrkB family protein [Vampirovibrionales bacterium]|nr:YihY/virulence factor BrkB family protein [Vampirovibrionales bacterium]